VGREVGTTMIRRAHQDFVDFIRRTEVQGYMREWIRREHARRSICPECQFESSEGYEESHTSNCSKRAPRGEEG
jgi:hypothetical protein